MKLQPLEPRRVRRPRGAWGWVDLRAVTQGHLEKVGTSAALTYLFLCSVGDTAGLSFWGHERMARVLGLDKEAIHQALDRLVATDLIARQGQIVQVLPIPDQTAVARALLQEPPSRSADTTRALPGSIASPGEPEPSIPIDETEVRSHLQQARAQMARFLGRRLPSESALLALARSLALKARRARCG